MKPLMTLLGTIGLLLPLAACAAKPALHPDAVPRADAPSARPVRARAAFNPKVVRTNARAAQDAAAAALKKDGDCALLHDSLRSLRDQDASIRAFTAKFGEAETAAMAKRVERNYAAKSCASWLERRGGVGAAWRRVRVSHWTSFRTR